MKTIKEKFDEVGVRPEVLRFAAAMEITPSASQSDRTNDGRGVIVLVPGGEDAHITAHWKEEGN